MEDFPSRHRPPHGGEQLSHEDYTVACICPMGVELAPVEAMLDKIHRPLPTSREQNAYTLGQLGPHNVVVAVMPQIGNNAAAAVATQLLNDFPSIRFSLLVGIGGGVPGGDDGPDVRLGDIVVGIPTSVFNGVVQYDMGKMHEGKRFERTGQLNKPPEILTANVKKLEAYHRRAGSRVSSFVADMIEKYPTMEPHYKHPGDELDQLYDSDYPHQNGPTCIQCDCTRRVSRFPRPDREPRIHYGTIGSANAVVKDAATREKLRRDTRILCLEMEAAGVSSSFPCMVIRGICDYADSHKNKQWQPYAAAVAAAYTKELLSTIPPQQAKNVSSARMLAQKTTPFQLRLHLFDAPEMEAHFFIGREPELAAMEDILKPFDISGTRRKLILGGIGGIGKTQLAISYAKRHRDTYDSIFWLNAASVHTLKASLCQLAGRIFPPDETQRCDDDQLSVRGLRWLSGTGNKRWLLIFDNHDQPDQYQIVKYFPYASHGSIIITTRLPDLVSGSPIRVQQLDRLEEGLHILESRSGRENTYSDIDAHRLVNRLKGLPLALATSGAYLKRSPITFRRYLEAYEKQWNLTPRYPTTLPEYEASTFYTTWDISFARLEKESPKIAELLKFLAYLNNEDIWYELVHAGMGRDSPKWLNHVAADDLAFADSMGRLVEYGFVEINHGNQSYSMHACVHDWTLHSLNRQVSPGKWLVGLFCVAYSSGPDILDFQSSQGTRRLVAHALRLQHTRFQGILCEVNVASDAMIGPTRRIARILETHAHHEAAKQIYHRLLQNCESIRGPTDECTLYFYRDLGETLTSQGKLDEAEPMLKRFLRECENALGLEHTMTFSAYCSLGRLYEVQSKLFEAQKMFKRALEGWEKTLGPHHEYTLMAADRLGAVCARLGQLTEAEHLITRALKGKEIILGRQHLRTLRSSFNLGALYSWQNKFTNAKEMMERAIEGYQNQLGARHPETLMMVSRLGQLFRDHGKVDEAEQLYVRKAVEIGKGVGAKWV